MMRRIGRVGFGTLAGIVFLFCTLVTLVSAEQERVIDNGNEGFSQKGFSSITDGEAFNGDVAVNAEVGNDEYARYSPDLTGQYDVYLYWQDSADKDTDVLWSVKHTKGITTHGFNQRNNPGWHFHGSYQLHNTSYVELRGTTPDCAVIADAVKFVPTKTRIIKRVAKDTITPISLNYGDELHFKLRNGQIRKVKLINTSAEVVSGNGKTVQKYSFTAVVQIEEKRYKIERILPAQESFYEPLVAQGIRLWLDSVTDIFVDDGGFLEEKDIGIGISCRPKRKARLVVSDVRDHICPERISWWYPEKKDHIDIQECYCGENVWMGPFNVDHAHGGLDVNMKSGTPLYTPIAIDDHYLFDSLKKGDNNNRWRGVRRWSNGAVWWLQAHHLNRLVVPEHKPLKQGTKYAETAGVFSGARQHTHFVFRVFEEGESYWIDPWIFFWQTFRDQARNQENRTQKVEDRKKPNKSIEATQ